jgi:hypothetical protein
MKLTKAAQRVATAATLFLLPVTHAVAQVSRQSRIEAGTSSGLPRTSEGHPNLEGYWVFGTPTPLERPEGFGKAPFFASDAEAEQFVRDAQTRRQATVTERIGVQEVREGLANEQFIELNGRKVTSMIFEPNDGRIPFISPRVQQAPIEERYDGPEDLPLSERCLKDLSGAPLVPNAGPSILQIVQSPDHLALFQEYGRELRVVPFGGGAHLSNRFQEWTGDSRGRWEGDTLVIDTTNFRDAMRQRRPSSRFDHNLHLTERLTLIRPDVIWYEFTVDDPTLFTRPWSAHFSLRKKDDRVFEFACHEGNYSLPNILRGARAQEAAQSGTAP